MNELSKSFRGKSWLEYKQMRRRHTLKTRYWCICTHMCIGISGNTKGGSITVPLTSCLTCLDQPVLQIETKIVSCHTADSKPVKQEINRTVILPPLVFPEYINTYTHNIPIYLHLLYIYVFEWMYERLHFEILSRYNYKNK